MHVIALDNVRVPVAVVPFVKDRVKDVEKVAPMVDRSTLFPLCAWRHSSHKILVVFFQRFDKGREFLLASKKHLPRGFERGTTTDRRSGVWDTAVAHATDHDCEFDPRVELYLYQVSAKGHRYQHLIF